MALDFALLYVPHITLNYKLNYYSSSVSNELPDSVALRNTFMLFGNTSCRMCLLGHINGSGVFDVKI